MIRAAFYAPMKSPDHAIPSGDRTMARALVEALDMAGMNPFLISQFQSRDGMGDKKVQAELFRASKKERHRLGKTPFDIWITYHNYYKAPDLLGPALCKASGKPYVQIEATRARKRLTGPWADFARAAEDACDAAKIVFYLTEHDRETLARHQPAGQSLVHLPPFLPSMKLPVSAEPGLENRPMLSAGMMRAGDKLQSYELIAQTLALLKTPDWTLQIAGDGPARPRIEARFASFGNRVRFLGQLSSHEMQEAYGKASLFLWPGVNEAFGMVYLEAQAAGLPVVAQDRPGVRDVLIGKDYPQIAEGPTGLAQMVDHLLSQGETRMSRGRSGRQMVQSEHLLGAAARRLGESLQKLARSS